MVEIPENEVSIATVPVPPVILKDPPLVKVLANLNNLYPYKGGVAIVDDVATLLSCQYFKIPVVESQDTTLPMAVDPTPIV